jgi:hypothetical protein
MALPSDFVPIILTAAAVKTETTAGQDAIAGSPANGDFIGGE